MGRRVSAGGLEIAKTVRSTGCWCLSVGAVVVLAVSGCASGGPAGAASSSPTGLPEDVKVCGFLSPSEVEKALEFTITRVSYSHRPGSGGGECFGLCGRTGGGDVVVTLFSDGSARGCQGVWFSSAVRGGESSRLHHNTGKLLASSWRWRGCGSCDFDFVLWYIFVSC